MNLSREFTQKKRLKLKMPSVTVRAFVSKIENVNYLMFFSIYAASIFAPFA